MAVAGGSGARVRVVIAGGGFAALEAALALRALAGTRAEMTLIPPSSRFAYRPAATAEVFGDAPPRVYDLEAIAGELGAVCRRDRLEAVAPAKKLVRLASGARLEYDALILALGARARTGVPGALTFRDQRDAPRLRGLLRELETLPVARLGVPVREFQPVWVLGTRLLGGSHPLFLCVEIDALGQPTAATLVHSESEQATRPAKVFGRYLTPYLEARERLAHMPGTPA